jgi:hypothetical protein
MNGDTTRLRREAAELNKDLQQMKPRWRNGRDFAAEVRR